MREPVVRAVTADLVDGHADDQFLTIGDAGGGQSFMVATQTLAAGRGVASIYDMRDVTMAYGDQMLDQLARAPHRRRRPDRNRD